MTALRIGLSAKRKGAKQRTIHYTRVNVMYHVEPFAIVRKTAF